MTKMSTFGENRDLMLGDEISNQLHYYTFRLNFRGDLSEHNKISWVVNDIVRKKIDSELKRNKIKKFALDITGIHDERDDDPKHAFIDGIKKIAKSEKKYPKVILKDTIKLLKDSDYYEWHDKGKVQSDQKFPIPPSNNIKGIPFVRGKHYDYIRLYLENCRNLQRLVNKTRQEVDYFIITWLTEFLEENINLREINYINSIQKNITLAKEAIEVKEEKSKLPDWDLEKNE